MTEPVLSVRDLTVRLPRGADRENAIEGISFDIGPREIVCIVGESGSGKSVTAQAVMGLLPKRDLVVTGGETRLEGEDTTKAGINRLRELRGTRMGMIFQEPMTALNPVMRVGDQIAEGLVCHGLAGWTAARSRAVELLEAVKIPDAARRARDYPHQLSGGMRQRVMIAIALACRPPLIIADEPTTALDVTIQAQVLDLLRELRTQFSLSLLLITHDFGVIAEMADRVAVMYRGRLVEEGPVRQILRDPQHDYTRTLLAAVPGAR
jgi:peptide/nickel transport system ATP-binding protein